MRLQRLRITAFGPFADPVDLDFAALNDAGLFLLTGSNGAGKSSILDAVCFALYGAVPGERNTARRFRSDHAAPDQAPTVELEAAFSDGTYRIVRTAAWERAKRRGTGTTVQQSSVSVSRRVDDRWLPVTSRLDEAGQLMTRLVGMNLTQFCQVVILPQGRFQAFLQASAHDRQALLQQLFHTGRFQRVEAWLREHRLTLRRASSEHESAVREVLNRISEVTGSAVPDTDEQARIWATDLTATTEAALAAAEHRVASATADESAHRAALDAGRALAARLGRLRSALSEQQSLLERSATVETLRLRVDAARRAGHVAVLTPLVESRTATLATTTAHRADLFAQLTDARADVPADLRAEAAALREAAHRFRALVPQADHAAALRDERSVLDAEHLSAEQRIAELLASDVTADVAALLARQDAVRAAELALPAVQLAIDECRTRLRAHDDIVGLTAEHAAAVAGLAGATTVALDAREAWLSVREARIEGMAAELAGGLAVGADCPVCGSHEHPHPARPHDDAPDAEAERAALHTLDDANAVQHAHDQQVRALAATLEQARATAGDSAVDTLRPTLDAHRARARSLTAEMGASAAVAAALAAAQDRARHEAGEVQELRERVAVLATRREHAGAGLALLDAELAAALAGTTYADARTAYADTTAVLTMVEAAIGADDDLATATRALAEAAEARSAAALEAGFGSATEAEQALVAADVLATHLDDLERHDQRVAAVADLLADPALRDLADTDEPDVTALASAHRAADEIRSVAVAEVATRRHALARLSTLLAELSARHEAWAPLRRDLEVATHLSSFCEGKAADNRWQTQLSAYVVAWRLSQVADAANLRLTVMTHGRYSLEHTDLRGAGERRGGMTLLVRDDWTGVTRDPVTLSGGESFVVALALALGLADVITAEAGGAALQTLFVDEGFGMLDATSLDLVMDTLDSLRESGRTVGVVSHVAEMRSRIPVQVQVDKPRDHGPSTVRLRA